MIEIESTNTRTSKGTHEFIIQGYSLLKGMGIGQYISSSPFTAGGHQWSVYFYPDGKNPDDDNSAFVSVFISLSSNATDVRVMFELTLVDQSGNGNHKVHSHFDQVLDPFTLKCRGSMWGYKRFYRREVFEKSEYLKDDCLIIRCVVGVVVTSLVPRRPLIIPDVVGKLEEEGCDVIFEVAGCENEKEDVDVNEVLDRFRAICLSVSLPASDALTEKLLARTETSSFVNGETGERTTNNPCIEPRVSPSAYMDLVMCRECNKYTMMMHEAMVCPRCGKQDLLNFEQERCF